MLCLYVGASTALQWDDIAVNALTMTTLMQPWRGPVHFVTPVIQAYMFDGICSAAAGCLLKDAEARVLLETIGSGERSTRSRGLLACVRAAAKLVWAARRLRRKQQTVENRLTLVYNRHVEAFQ